MRLRYLLSLLLFACSVCVTGIGHAAINASSLGANYNAGQTSITFKVYSSRATQIEVFMYNSPTGVQEAATAWLTNASGIWSVTIPVSTLQSMGLTGTIYYGYRAWGPNWPYNASWTKGSATGFISDVDASGNRFNPNKLLLDPYALEMSHDPLTPAMNNGTVYGSGSLYRNQDTGTVAPKGIVLTAANKGSGTFGTKPTRAFKDDIVYEVNVRGLTMNDPSVTAAYRGTYLGASQKAAYLASLGITAVEFLPVQETQNDANNLTPNSDAGDNYWGYMTLDYFAPDRYYAYDKSVGGPTREFKAMVNAFHAQGIKVFIDVVYNHTGEGGPWSSSDKTTYNIYGMRGLDNVTYYSLTSDFQSPWDNTGVGGNYNTYNTVAQNLIVDSLAYWSNTLGVDGFRFDLASVLGNTCQDGCYNFDKTNTNVAINRIPRELPPRPAAGGSGVDLIAEPWAIGGNSYQVGGFPVGWAEWNGIYRDTLRQNQNDLGAVGISQLATRYAGSSDLYQGNGRFPNASVNFMVAHDGFTLNDLYGCNGPNNNQAWPLGPSDGGSTTNYSWDQGGVASAQRQAARYGMALMMLSAGVPMTTGGDEMLRSLTCNNNPYNLDSVGNWLNWSLSSDQTNFKTFTQGMIAFRKAHAALRPANFYSASDNNGNGMDQLDWFQPSGAIADSTYFNNASNYALAWRIDGTELGDAYSSIYVATNAWTGNVNFTLPWPGSGKNWYRVTDTCSWAEGTGQVAAPGSEAYIGPQNTVYGVCGRGLLVLIAK